MSDIISATAGRYRFARRTLPLPPPAGGLVWTQVSDVAGWLELCADIAPDACAYYQVTGGAGPIAAALWYTVWIFDPATSATTSHDVKMGPFSAEGAAHLYATQASRRTRPAPPGLAPFPPVPPGSRVFWANDGLVLATDGRTLLGGIPRGKVDLTLVGYDGAFAPTGAVSETPLTLDIDALLGWEKEERASPEGPTPDGKQTEGLLF